MSTTTTTAATTPALNSYLPVLARLLMCSLFIWDGVLQLRNPRRGGLFHEPQCSGAAHRGLGFDRGPSSRRRGNPDRLYDAMDGGFLA